MARPSLFTEELADEICTLLASGQSLNAICKQDDMPGISTVLSWLSKAEDGEVKYKAFLDKYLRAREIQADTIFDECLDIADESGADAIVNAETGKLVVQGEVIQRAKLRIDTRMRMAGKLRPKKYGDKQSIDVEIKEALTKEQRDAAVAAALSAES
jgi:hypothetical protein